MAQYIKANHVSGQIIISAVNDSLGYDSVRATIALDCDTAIDKDTSNGLVGLIADNGIQYYLDFNVTRVFNNGVEQTIANLDALEAWAAGHKSTACASGGDGLAAVQGDTNPFLGGNLNVNSYYIVSTGSLLDHIGFVAAGSILGQIGTTNAGTAFAISNSDEVTVFSVNGAGAAFILGDLAVGGTVNGRDISADGSEWDDFKTLVSLPSGDTLSAIASPASDDQVLVVDADGNLGYIAYSNFGGSGSWDAAASETLTNKTINALNNTITNVGAANFDLDIKGLMALFQGCALDDPQIAVSSDGSTVTLSLEKSGGGDVRMYFSDGMHTHDTTPAATVALTAGTDTVPVMNYVYVLQSNKTLTVSTSGFPTAEHVPIAEVYCQSAASVQTDGPYKVHQWSDHTESSTGQGHLGHLNHWIRDQQATYDSGIVLSATGGASTFDIATTSGFVYQLHRHAFPAFNTATGSDLYIVNDATTAFKKVSNLAGETTDANGDSIAGRWFSYTLIGVASEASSDCKILVLKSSGSYNNNNANKAILDVEGYSNYYIPDEFIGTAFLIGRVVASESGGTITIEDIIQLTGQVPNTTAGVSASGVIVPVDAYDILSATATQLETESNWSFDNLYTGSTIDSADLVAGKRHVHSSDPKVTFECFPDTTDYWIRTTGRDRAVWPFKLGLESEDATESTSVPKLTIYADEDFEIKDVRVGCVVAPVGEDAIIDVHVNGTTIFGGGTKAVIAASSNTGSQSTIATTSVSQGAKLEFFIDNIGTTNAGQGYYVTLKVHLK